MIHDATYYEVQKFNQPLLKGIVYVILAIGVAVPVFAYSRGELSPVAFLALAVAATVFFLFRTIKFFLWIDAEGIRYRFHPFHVKARTIAKRDIKAVSVGKYSPIAEYGGWGIRYGRNGRAYSVSGRYGMRVSLVNTKKNILIGTTAPKEVLSALTQHQYPMDEISVTPEQ